MTKVNHRTFFVGPFSPRWAKKDPQKKKKERSAEG
jgi:hypothetical protein